MLDAENAASYVRRKKSHVQHLECGFSGLRVLDANGLASYVRRKEPCVQHLYVGAPGFLSVRRRIWCVLFKTHGQIASNTLSALAAYIRSRSMAPWGILFSTSSPSSPTTREMFSGGVWSLGERERGM